LAPRGSADRCWSGQIRRNALQEAAKTMGKSLIIAEKPSVAADIARSLGGFTKEGDFFESDDYVLSSAVGHLVEIAAPEQFEVKRGKWSFAHLPVIPPHFDLRPIDRSASPDCPARQGKAAGAQTVAAVDDTQRHSRGLCQTAR